MLNTIFENTDNWDLDKGNEPHLEYEYTYVENFSTSPSFEELGNRFGLDPLVLVEVVKSFANHIVVPKEGFTEYVEPVKHSIIMPKPIKQVNIVSSYQAKEYIETPPYPSRVQENLLIVVANKSARRDCTPYEQIKVQHQISAIKELSEEDPCDVYLCEDSTKVIKGNTTKVDKPIISVAIGTSCYHGLCDIGASINVIPYALYLEIKPNIDPI